MNKYFPASVSHPKETLKDLMRERNLTIRDLSKLTGLQRHNVRSILKGNLWQLEYAIPFLCAQNLGDEKFWQARIEIFKTWIKLEAKEHMKKIKTSKPSLIG